ncbi:ribosome biogenesis GTPase Der [Calycomorphotria hydatis]|uniref:GTPase Der n=1 Tax=Calycomorphotria hydatis TaxID=2528027 RepID=A0A517TCQ7_9PLAN|nr:ribosome biogenesis GTPase Der [Calycomorphotria hydatis]QDT66154.1 GTPase Der [Calycomorphotria hydatis]
MSVPRVAIVGRPNVGKSSLFNWIARKRISIVDPTAGVTRDRVTFIVHEADRYFELVDTGGIGIIDSDALEADVEQQINIGIKEADLILFVVDAATGVLPLDSDVAEILRSVNTPKLLIANKCDSPKLEAELAEFMGLANAEVVATSVTGGRNRDLLLEAIINALPPAEADEAKEGAALQAEPEMKLAIVGRRNAGKSTFINALAQQERVIVSEVAGTTRDSIDVRFEGDGKSILAIDTPGVRRRKSLANDVEYYGLLRAKKSIRRADVVLMFFDASKTISKVDKQLVEEISENYKPCIFVVNKWDLGLEADMTAEKWGIYLQKTFSTLSFVPVAFITAKTSRNVKTLVNLAQSVFKQARERVSTGKLNSVVRAAIDRQPPAVKKNRRPKIFYAVQVATEPPTIVLKCNDPKIFTDHWKRYLLRVLREELPFEEIPIKLLFRSREARDHRDGKLVAAQEEIAATED